MRGNKTIRALAFFLLLPAAGQAQPPSDLYVRCNFQPHLQICRDLLKASDNSPAGESVRRAYESYGRYLGGPSIALTQEDRHYLAASGIDLPDGLSPSDAAGLHRVINDPALAADPQERRRAVNGFLRRAVAAELYCGFDACGA